jgi:uncharacterized membrane protein YdjX (TVP38/TMEM64 family)
MVVRMHEGPDPASEPAPRPTAAAASLPAGPGWPGILAWAAAVAILLAVVYLSPLRLWLGRVREVSEHIRAAGIWAPLLLMLGIAALVAVGFPRLALCFISGMALGFWSGLLWAQLGTLLGNYGIFLVARFAARQWAETRLSRGGRLHTLIQREGIAGVILARQVPVPGLLVNLACALFPLRHRQFLIGTLLGQLPEAVPVTLMGAGLLGGSFTKSAGLVSLGVVAAVAAWLGFRRARTRK